MRWLVLVAVAGCGRLSFDPIATTTDAGLDTFDACSGPSVKSLHRADYVMATTPQLATFPAVDPNRTFVLCSFRTLGSDAARMPTCELLDPTTVAITTELPYADVVVSLQVIEFTCGVTVQRNSRSFTDNELVANIPIMPIRRDRAFALLTRRTNHINNNNDPRFMMSATLTSDTSLELRRASQDLAADTLDVAWQVIEIGAATVQAGTTAIADGATSAPPTTIAPVALDQTFLVFATHGFSSNESDYSARGDLVDATTLRFERASTLTQVNISWFTVSVPGTQVQRESYVANNELVVTRPLIPVEPGRSMVVHAASGGDLAMSGELDVVSFSSRLSSTQLQLEREMSNAMTGVVSWFVVQWPQ